MKAAPAERLAGSPRYPWYVVGMLWFICFFNYADRQAIFSIFPVLKERFGFSGEELGQIGMAFMVVYALTAPFAGQVGDRHSRKALILGGLYAWSLVTGFTALCSKVWHFVAVRAAEGLGETFYFPASMSLISDYHGKATRSRAMGFHQTSVYVGTIGGGALAGWMAMHWGWEAPFVVLAGAGIVLGVVLAVFIREPARNAADRLEKTGGPDAEEAPPPMGQFLLEWARTPSAVLLLLAFFGANTVAAVFLVWMPSFLKEKFRLNLAMAGLEATVFIQLASLAGAAAGGALADAWRARRPGGRILTQAVGALLGAPFVFFCGTTRDHLSLIAAMTLFGFFKGVYDSNIWASLYDVIRPSRRGAGVGLMNMVAWMAGALLGSYLPGRLSDAGITLSTTIAALALFYVVVAALLLAAGLVYAPRDVKRAGAA